MLRSFGGPELLILLVIVLLVFGVGRISKIGKELGSGIRSFREGLKGEDEEEDNSDETE
ncbi:MAG TPA: twin-arginine translocase TatA/TatE family subunit [Anaerolineales bacterium]|jgi:sec-independent protein translocase protein TatA|nr:twin-arginine translocase TatA/TatE family subunit [Anaerolineales bacterium]